MSAADADAVAVVLDAAAQNVAHVAADVENFGGGWRSGIQTWRQIGFPYLVLIAPNRRRIRAPFALAARDLAALAEAIRTACGMLEDAKCAWIRALGPEALALVDDEITADSRARLANVPTGGHA